MCEAPREHGHAVAFGARRSRVPRRAACRADHGRTRVVPRGSGGGIPGNGGWTGLAFGRFFSGRGLATPASVAEEGTTGIPRHGPLLRVPSSCRALRARLMRSQGCQRRALVTVSFWQVGCQQFSPYRVLSPKPRLSVSEIRVPCSIARRE